MDTETTDEAFKPYLEDGSGDERFEEAKGGGEKVFDGCTANREREMKKGMKKAMRPI
jgi:hypothetical protein